MQFENKIMDFAAEKRFFTTKDVAEKLGISRQYAHLVIKKLVQQQKLVKFGSTRGAHYGHPVYIHQAANKVKRRLLNKDLEEHKVLDELEKNSWSLKLARENLRSVYHYAFSEMLNNAIEHSKSKYVEVDISNNEGELIFHVDDFGIGVFRNVMRKRKLDSELEAIQDLLKGKTTTQPKSHSGEGIFFTSKVADIFILESYDYRLRVDNRVQDYFIEEMHPKKRGTRVTFILSMRSKRHLSEVFEKYQTDPKELTFDKTEIQVRLYTTGTIHISRSQARRVMAGLEKFNMITLDFDRVPTVGQAFVDEIFRVFKNKHPHIKIIPVNMNKTVKFMVERVR